MKVSVVIPVFNSEKTINEVVQRTINTMNSEKLSYEIVLVDDGSTDESWNKINALATNNENIIAIKLLKNFGQHSANLCGFRHCKHNVIVTIDDDLQNPPEEIPKLLSLVSQGKDLVFGKFKEKQHGLIRSIGSKVVEKLNKKIFKVKEDVSITNFRAITREVIDLVCSENHFRPYIPGLLLKHSNNRGNIQVIHNKRVGGKSNYSLTKLISLIIDLLFQHSNLPLRFASSIGFVASFLAFILGLSFVYSSFVTETEVPGWASLAVLLSFFSGLLILLISIIGEYLLRILRQTNASKPYTVSKTVNK
jgi:glycosyltransferase involved in cell wall biosynthesis